MTLAEAQAKFQAAILGDDAAILASLADSLKTDRATLFAVYHDGYRRRLAEFLSHDFPMLRARLDEDEFGRLVEDYILSAPSQQRNARWYGARLPDFMRETQPWRACREAIDLARFERALSDVFDAADAPVRSLAALADIGAEDWPRIAFEFHPSFNLLELAGGTMALYAALANAEEPPAVRPDEESIIFWRNDGQSFYRRVSEDERLALIEASLGKKFSDICTLLAYQGSDQDVTQKVAGYLAQWFADGFVAGLSIRE